MIEPQFKVPIIKNPQNLFTYLSQVCEKNNKHEGTPVRFVITKTDEEHYHCEVDLVSFDNLQRNINGQSIFSFRKRDFENTKEFNVAFLIPTGIGSDIGGPCWRCHSSSTSYSFYV